MFIIAISIIIMTLIIHKARCETNTEYQMTAKMSRVNNFEECHLVLIQFYFYKLLH
jgi:hypothetical protein